MQRVKETIKDKLNMGKDKDNTAYDNTYGNTYGTTGYNTAGTTSYGATGNLAVESTHTSTTSSTSSGLGEAVAERPVAVGVAEVPVVVTEQERVRTEGYHTEQRMTEEVCGTKTFTEVEDRPIVKERVERILEHQPVEKQYVVETRFVGEKAIPSATGATIIDSTERVVERAEPGPKCPIGTGQVLEDTVNQFSRRV